MAAYGRKWTKNQGDYRCLALEGNSIFSRPPCYVRMIHSEYIVDVVKYPLPVQRPGLSNDTPQAGFDDRVVAHVEVGGSPGPPPPYLLEGVRTPHLASHQSLPPGH
jgi:hypothetical protein